MLLLTTAFITGASVMVIELVGSRIVAPYVGTSIFVWTALIGVVLASLSVGYALGGRLADKDANERTLSLLLFLSSIATAGILLLRSAASFLGLISGQFGFGSILIATLIFVPATIILGMVTPYVARLSITNVEHSGRTVGNLYAVSTVGSIVGTFAGGFLLISYFGNTKIILGTAFLLLLLSAFILFKNRGVGRAYTQTIIGLGIILSAHMVPPYVPVPGELVYDGDTPYRRVWIFDSREQSSGRPIRIFTDTISGYHSGIRLDADNELLFDYTRYFELADFFYPNPEQTLMIGGAVQTFPSYYAKRHENMIMDSVEIDPALLPLATAYFNFHNTHNVRPVHEDARIFLNTTEKAYDVVFVDAFSSILAVPFHLTTSEAIAHLDRITENKGVVIVNLISATKGHGSKLFRSLYATFSEHFKNVHAFRMSPSSSPEAIQNILLVGTNNDAIPKPPFASSNIAWNALLKNYFVPEGEAGFVLTDDYAPVERFVTEAFIGG